jgi:hypothetical protein
MKTDRLKTFSIILVVAIALILGLEIFNHAGSQSNLVIPLIFLLLAVEKIRLELRDIREELQKRTTAPEVLSTRQI